MIVGCPCNSQAQILLPMRTHCEPNRMPSPSPSVDTCRKFWAWKFHYTQIHRFSVVRAYIRSIRYDRPFWRGLNSSSAIERAGTRADPGASRRARRWFCRISSRYDDWRIGTGTETSKYGTGGHSTDATIYNCLDHFIGESLTSLIAVLHVFFRTEFDCLRIVSENQIDEAASWKCSADMYLFIHISVVDLVTSVLIAPLRSATLWCSRSLRLVAPTLSFLGRSALLWFAGMLYVYVN